MIDDDETEKTPLSVLGGKCEEDIDREQVRVVSDTE